MSVKHPVEETVVQELNNVLSSIDSATEIAFETDSETDIDIPVLEVYSVLEEGNSLWVNFDDPEDPSDDWQHPIEYLFTATSDGAYSGPTARLEKAMPVHDMIGTIVDVTVESEDRVTVEWVPVN